ncbi:MAG: carbohydrate kinase family protein, partial [Candidatus Zixiibacteriota bacterium]
VTRADGSRHEGYGGILYNLAVLSALSPSGVSVCPITNVGRDCSREILDRLEQYAGLESQGVCIVAKPNNHCILRYRDAASKTEVLRGWVGGVSRRQLRSVVDADVILINFISGADISGRNLHWLRGQYEGNVYMDFHSRSLGRRRDGSRFLRRPDDWKEYLGCADIAQMNELEFELLSGHKANEISCTDFLKRQLGRTRCLIVPRGSQGCFLIRRLGATIQFTSISAPHVAKVTDTTGCGDIFSAGFIANYLTTGKEVTAAHYATKLASWRVGFDDFFKIDLGAFSKKGRSETSGDILRNSQRNI